MITLDSRVSKEEKLRWRQWRFWGLHLGGSGVAIIAAWGAWTYIAIVNHPEQMVNYALS